MRIAKIIFLLSLQLVVFSAQAQLKKPTVAQKQVPTKQISQSSNNIKENPEYSLGLDYSEGLIVVKKKGRYGYADKKGEIVIPLKFTFAERFSEGLAFIQLNGKYGFINKNGDVVFYTNYQSVEYFFKNGITSVRNNYKMYIDTTGRVLSDSEEKSYLAEIELEEFNSKGPYSRYNIYKDKYGFVNLKGEYVIEPKYDDANSFSEGFARVKLNDKWGFINKAGELVIEPQFDDVDDFSNGLAIFKIGKNKGYIDKAGKIVLSNLKFDELCDFNRFNLACVSVNEKYGYIDKKGKIVIPIIYDGSDGFSDGLALVQINGKYGYIDITGKVVIPIIHSYFYW